LQVKVIAAQQLCKFVLEFSQFMNEKPTTEVPIDFFKY